MIWHLLNKYFSRLRSLISLFCLLNSFLEIFLHCLFLELFLFSFLFFQQSFFFRTFFFTSFLSGKRIFLSFLFILFQFLRIWLSLHKFDFHLFKNSNNLVFNIFLDPFFHDISCFIFLCGLHFFNNHIIQIITENLLHFIASFRIILWLIFTYFNIKCTEDG